MWRDVQFWWYEKTGRLYVCLQAALVHAAQWALRRRDGLNKAVEAKLTKMRLIRNEIVAERNELQQEVNRLRAEAGLLHEKGPK